MDNRDIDYIQNKINAKSGRTSSEQLNTSRQLCHTIGKQVTLIIGPRLLSVRSKEKTPPSQTPNRTPDNDTGSKIPNKTRSYSKERKTRESKRGSRGSGDRNNTRLEMVPWQQTALQARIARLEK